MCIRDRYGNWSVNLQNMSPIPSGIILTDMESSVGSIGSSKVSFVIVTSQSGGDTWENIYVVGRWK